MTAWISGILEELLNKRCGLADIADITGTTDSSIILGQGACTATETTPQLGLANWKLHGRRPRAIAGSQKPPALNPKCTLCLEHLPGQREREFRQGWRHEIKECIPDLQTHPPTRQSAPWEEGLSSPCCSCFKESQKKSSKWQGGACHGQWCQHSTVLCWTAFLI